MAVTKIWNIRGRAGSPLMYVINPEKTERDFSDTEKQALQDVIAYAANEDKTESFFYTTGNGQGLVYGKRAAQTILAERG